MKQHIIKIIVPALLLSACSQIPSTAYFSRGTPESLLDVSSEAVSAPIDSEVAIDSLIDWIEEDQPSSAELYCYPEDIFCSAAEEVMSLYGVDYDIIPSEDSVANLMYERVQARDCENRYIDNAINPYNLNHPTFGCSVASNMVQMVSDKQQFIKPDLLGYPGARRALNAHNEYLNGEDELTEDTDFQASRVSVE